MPEAPQTFSKKVIASWAGYDFAQSAFSGIMITFVFPIYFGNVIVPDHQKGDFYWGIAMSVSMLIVALTTPVLGAMADQAQSKKKYLMLFAGSCIVGTVALYFMQPGMIAASMLLFIFANSGYEGGIVFYDAFLPEIVPKHLYGRISGYGFAAGYLGSLTILLIIAGYVTEHPSLTFLTAALFFLIFSLPMFLVVPEKKRIAQTFTESAFKRGFREIRTTVRNINKHKNLVRFLIAFFLYNDAILTVVGFSGRYASETLKFSMSDLVKFFLMVQVVAIIGSVGFGFVTDRKGPKFTIVVTLIIWVAVVIGAYFAVTPGPYYVVGAVAGLALGSSQSASRSLMALLTPKNHTAEFFGFYDGFTGRASAVLGPFIYGGLSYFFGPRPAIVALGTFFLAGLILMKNVRTTSSKDSEVLAEVV